MKYRYLDSEATADLAVEAEGRTLKDAFESAAFAVMDTIADTSKVEEQEIRLIHKKAEDLKSLLYDLLDEIVFLFDAERMLFRSVEIRELDEKSFSLSAVLKGEPYDKKKHELRYNVKAITYFGMKIARKKSGYGIRLTLDL